MGSVGDDAPPDGASWGGAVFFGPVRARSGAWRVFSWMLHVLCMCARMEMCVHPTACFYLVARARMCCIRACCAGMGRGRRPARADARAAPPDLDFAFVRPRPQACLECVRASGFSVAF